MRSSVASLMYTAEHHYLFKGTTVFEYQTETDLLN